MSQGRSQPRRCAASTMRERAAASSGAHGALVQLDDLLGGELLGIETTKGLGSGLA